MTLGSMSTDLATALLPLLGAGSTSLYAHVCSERIARNRRLRAIFDCLPRLPMLEIWRSRSSDLGFTATLTEACYPCAVEMPDIVPLRPA
jgi:hypothetical protein